VKKFVHTVLPEFLNAHNNSIIAYHGTYANIDSFSIESSKSHGGFDSDLGIHFGSRAAAIDRLKENAGDEDYIKGTVSHGAKIIKVDTGIRNPLILSKDIGDWSNLSELKNILSIENNKINTIEDIKKYIMVSGYDGIQYPNSYEGVKGEPSYISLYPNRIKIINIEKLK
jgi:hypothetical protein